MHKLLRSSRVLANGPSLRGPKKQAAVVATSNCYLNIKKDGVDPVELQEAQTDFWIPDLARQFSRNAHAIAAKNRNVAYQ